MRSWIESLNPDAVVDEDRFVDWLYDEGFTDHPGRRNEFISATCPECGTGSKRWRFMVRSDGWANCYSCGYATRNGFKVVEDWTGCTQSEAQEQVGSLHFAGDDVVWETAPAPGPPPEAAAPVYVAPDVSGVWWWDGSSSFREAWMADALEATVARGFTREFLLSKAIGFGVLGRYQGRVVLPVFFGGHFVWLQAWDWTRTEEIKYQSPKRVEGAVNRRDLLGQWDLYGGTTGTLVVTEGIFNGWSAEVAGFPTVFTFGKAMTDEQRALLLSSPAATIVLAHDDDARFLSGPSAAEMVRQGRDVRLVNYPDPRDLDERDVASRRLLIEQATPPHWLDDGARWSKPKRVSIAGPPRR